MVAVRENPSLTIVRRLKANPERVWRALTQAEELKRWFYPTPGFTVLHAEADLRVGGRFNIVVRSPDGETHDVSGVYREIVPHRKVVHTWAWKNTPERESLVTFELRADAGGTQLTLRHEQFFDDEARDKHRHGWTGCLDTLEKLLG